METIKAGFGIEFIHYLKQETVCSVVYREENMVFSNAKEPQEQKSTDFTGNLRVLTFHRDGYLNLWSIKAASGLKNIRTVKSPYNVEQLIFAPLLNVVIALTNQNMVAFFDRNLELIKTLQIENLMTISFCPVLNVLAVASPTEVKVFEVGYESVMRKLKLETTLKYTLEPKSRMNQTILKVVVESKRKKLLVLFETGIHLFDLTTGMTCPVNENISKRAIVDVVYFEIPQLYVVSCSDGTLNLLNDGLSNLAKVLAVRGQITAIVKHPNGTHLILAGTDNQIKMITVHNLVTVFSYSVPVLPYSLEFTMQDSLVFQGLKTVGVIKLNLIGSYLSQLSSSVKQLWSIPRQDKPWQIVAISEEGLLRIVSTVTGKSLTSLLPTSSLDEMQDLIYCEKMNKMFILMATGNIWCVSTIVNPCKILEVWKTGNQVSTSLGLWTGRDNDQLIQILISGTDKGELELFDKFGNIRSTIPVHTSAIVKILNIPNNENLLLLTHDNQIRIVTLNTKSLTFQLVMSFGLSTKPLSIVNSADAVCYSGEDGVIHLTRFDQPAKRFEEIGHPRNDDHFDRVTSICRCEKLDIFVSAGLDSQFKIWSSRNQLLKTVNIRQPITCLAMGNEDGDLIVGINDKLECFGPEIYFPDAKSTNSTSKSDDFEEEISHHDDNVPTLIKNQKIKRFGMATHEEKINLLNLLEIERESIVSLKKDQSITLHKANSQFMRSFDHLKSSEQLMKDLELSISLSGTESEYSQETEESEDDEYVKELEPNFPVLDPVSPKTIRGDGFVPNSVVLEKLGDLVVRDYNLNLSKRPSKKEEKQEKVEIQEDAQAYKDRIKMMLQKMKERDPEPLPVLVMSDEPPEIDQEMLEASFIPEISEPDDSALDHLKDANADFIKKATNKQSVRLPSHYPSRRVSAVPEPTPEPIVEVQVPVVPPPIFIEILQNFAGISSLAKSTEAPVLVSAPSAETSTNASSSTTDYPDFGQILKLMEKQMFENSDKLRRQVLDYIFSVSQITEFKQDIYKWLIKVYEKAELIESNKIRIATMETLKKIDATFYLPYVLLAYASDNQDLRNLGTNILTSFGVEVPMDKAVQTRLFQIAIEHARMYRRTQHAIYLDQFIPKKETGIAFVSKGRFYDDFELFLNMSLQSWLCSKTLDESVQLMLKSTNPPSIREPQDYVPSAYAELDCWKKPKFSDYMNALQYLSAQEKQKRLVNEEVARLKKLEQQKQKRDLSKPKQSTKKQEPVKPLELVVKPKRKHKKGDKWGLPIAISKCHQSRETMEYVYRTLPPVNGDQPARKATTLLEQHLRRLNNTLPIEKLQLDPFSEQKEATFREDEEGNRYWKKYWMA